MLAQKYLTINFQLLTLFTLVCSNILLLYGCVSVINGESRENMIFIPEGPFTMGFKIDNNNEWGDMDEEPVHRVTLSSYWIDKYEVTSSNFSTFLNKNKNEAHRFIEITPAVTIELENNMYRPRKGLENYPVNRVSWFGADAYCRWKGKRLPTEAEWEKQQEEPIKEYFLGEMNFQITVGSPIEENLMSKGFRLWNRWTE